jgi:putative ABC transport system permease protein
MIFHPGALDGLPTTYLTSFYLEPSQRNRVPELIRSFPGATFFDVGFLLDRIQSIVKQLGHVVDLILYFALLAAITVLVAIEFILYEGRMYTAAVYKALGATNKILRKVYRYQYLLAGVVAGMVAYAINAVVSILLSEYVIGGAFVFNLKTLLICLVITPMLVVITGLISIHRTKNITPMKLLTQSSGY